MKHTNINARLHYGERSHERYIAAAVQLSIKDSNLTVTGITKAFQRRDEFRGDIFRDGVDLSISSSLSFFNLLQLQQLIVDELTPKNETENKADKVRQNLSCKCDVKYGERCENKGAEVLINILGGIIEFHRHYEAGVYFQLSIDANKAQLRQLHIELCKEILRRHRTQPRNKPSVSH